MKKLPILILLLSSVMSKGFAQTTDKTSNHLLWRISGNGLPGSSYLFGTMHLTDKRLFYFGDSLYAAMERSEGFAAELDMNSMFTHYINYITSDDKAKTYLEDVVDKATLQKHKEKLEKKFRKPISKITTDDIESEEERMIGEYLRAGEMSTFMDAYLFDIADRQGKWTGGIEDPMDQFGIRDDLVPEDRIEAMFEKKQLKDRGLEWMIRTYLNEDLELIDRTEQIWKGAKDVILINRNGKMSYRIDSLARIRTVVFAIGAAHLPGDSGVINLLRQKGYTLTPVISSKKIAPEKYTFKEKEKSWVDVYMGDSLFKVQMPVLPEPFKAFDGPVMNMRFHFDLATYSAFFTLSVPTAVISEERKDSILDRIVANYKAKTTLISEKKIKRGDVIGREIILTNEYGEFRLQALIPGEYVALNALFAMKKQALHSKNAEKFFTSFQPLKKTSHSIAGAASTDKWQRFIFEEDAFAVEMPGKYRIRSEAGAEEDAWKRVSYEVIDLSSQAYYGVAVDVVKQGYYSDKDSIYFESNKKILAEAMKGELISDSFFHIQGYPAYNMEIKSKEGGTTVMTKILMLNRGNRRYLLFKTYDPKFTLTAADQRFFNSFAILPLAKSNWQKVEAPDNSFSTWAPGTFNTEKTDEKNVSTRYSIYDKASAVTVYVDKEVFPAFYWIESDSIFWNDRVETFKSWNDSVVSRKMVKNGNTEALDLVISLDQSQNIKKMRLMWSGDTLYTIFSHIPKDVYEAGDYPKLFDQFRLRNEQKPINIFVPKQEALLTALSGTDSATLANARQALDDIHFSKKDIPFLQQALLRIYPDFDTSYFYESNTNAIIASKIISLDSGRSSLDFVRQTYPSLRDDKELLKPLLLSLLSANTTSESYDLLRQFIAKTPPAVDARYFLYHGIYDSLSLSKTLFPDALTAIENKGLQQFITALAVNLLDSNLISPSMIREHKTALIKVAGEILEQTPEELNENPYEYYNLVQLLGKVNDAESNEMLRKFANMDDPGIKFETIAALACNGQPVTKKEVLDLAERDEHRHALYDKLKACNKLALFPAAQLSQKLMGQSRLFSQLYDEEEEPEKISFVGERVIDFAGGKKRIFLYKIMYTEDDPETHYLGFAGPFALDVKDISSDHKLTGVNWMQSFDAGKLNESMKEYLKKIDEEGR